MALEANPQSILPRWASNAHRLVASHFPPISLFEEVASESEFEILYALEELTNDRLREGSGDIHLIEPSDRIFGPGTTPVMAAFTHIGIKSRFTDGTYGVYYAASSLDVAIAETVHHREAFLATTQEPDTELTMRQYINSIQLPLLDIRGDLYRDLHNPNDYSHSQTFAKNERQKGLNGLLYYSVRSSDGECAACFKPTVLSTAHQGKHLRYVWNGREQRIRDVFEVSELQ